MQKLPLLWLVSALVLALGLLKPEDAAASGKMYWTDNVTGKIQRADLDGANIEDLVTGLSNPYGIALDLASGICPPQPLAGCKRPIQSDKGF